MSMDVHSVFLQMCSGTLTCDVLCQQVINTDHKSQNVPFTHMDANTQVIDLFI